MFAIPGTIALIAFIYVRPQEVFTGLQRLPLLYMFFALAIFGLIVDLRLRVSRPRLVPQMPWVIGLYLWSLLTVALNAPQVLTDRAIEIAIPVILFVVIAHSVQSFRMLQVVAAALLALVIFLAALGVQQGNADWGCVQLDPSGPSDLSSGHFDGRSCQTDRMCYGGDAAPGADYACERIGMLGTTSVGHGRVRYRGVLQDPNELALTIGLGLALMLAFFDRKKSGSRVVIMVFTFVLVLTCVMYTESRGGQLVFLTVIGAYFVRRYGWRGAVAGMLVALPVLMLAGSGARHDATSSTDERMETLYTGIDIFRSSPLYGVGEGQFTEYNYLTAHNSYVLAAAELGIVGFFLFASVLYISIKIPIEALRRYAGRPDAAVAATWAMALLALLAGLYVGSFFLSFTWHHVLWIHLGLSGALYSAIRTHDPEFTVRYGALDMVGVGAFCVILLPFLFVYLRLKGV